MDPSISPSTIIWQPAIGLELTWRHPVQSGDAIRTAVLLARPPAQPRLPLGYLDNFQNQSCGFLNRRSEVRVFPGPPILQALAKPASRQSIHRVNIGVNKPAGLKSKLHSLAFIATASSRDHAFGFLVCRDAPLRGQLVDHLRKLPAQPRKQLLAGHSSLLHQP